MKAVWNGTVVAESDRTIVVEGSHYFPPESIRPQFFVDSDRHTRCIWKGKASYKTLVVDDDVNPDAAWYYPSPSRLAKKIRGYYAFWMGVEVIE